MAEPLRRTSMATRALLSVLLETPSEDRYGLDLGSQAGLKSGTLYPILDRLEQQGWLSSHWETGTPSDHGRPRRRYYRLTGQGVVLARETLRAAPAASARWLPAGAQ